MNREDIIQMAWEASIVRFEGGEMEAYGIRKADQFDHTKAFWSFASPENLKRFAVLVAAAAKAEEREACAKVCEDLESVSPEEDNPAPWYIANAIRARGRTL